MKKFQVGDKIAKRQLVSIHQSTIQIPHDRLLVHLQFRRFAGCPFCNLHLQQMAQRSAEIAAAGIVEVVVFHSSAESLLDFHGEQPFAVIADPDKKLYGEFGVETALRSLLDPRVWLAGIRQGAFKVRSANPAKGESPLGLPADFLIAPNGSIVACKYGRHAYDQWSVDQLLELVRSNPVAASQPC